MLFALADCFGLKHDSVMILPMASPVLRFASGVARDKYGDNPCRSGSAHRTSM